MNKGFLEVYSKCSLKNCGVKWREKIENPVYLCLGLEGRTEGGVVLVYSSA